MQAAAWGFCFAWMLLTIATQTWFASTAWALLVPRIGPRACRVRKGPGRPPRPGVASCRFWRCLAA